MLKNYVKAERKEDVSYDLDFLFEEDHGGYGFPCDEKGNVLPFQNEEIKKNYEWCMAHPEKFETFAKVTKYVNRYTEPAHGTCACGEEVYLFDQYLGACECPNCGRWYNLFGQELNPPSTWEDGDDW